MTDEFIEEGSEVETYLDVVESWGWSDLDAYIDDAIGDFIDEVVGPYG